MTSFAGHTIVYDAIGNPISYYNGTAYTFDWTGRQLTGAVKGSKTMSFTYNDEGIRTSKTVNGVKHTYKLNGSQIVSEEWEDKLIIYLYDSTGMPIGMMYRTTSYTVDQWDIFWFEKNLQGDIVAIYNESGTKVATYTYADAWGNHSVTYSNGGGSTGAQYNPFRYRGYYYDTDLGMYYLQSRYYDAKICRFINADGYVSTGQGLTGYNMFAYCENNPVNCVDYSGESALGIALLLLLGVGALGVLTSCENPDANNLYDTYGDVGDMIGFVDDSVQFKEDLTVYEKYMYSYSTAVSHYYQTNQLFWDEYLEEAFYNNKERCIQSIEQDINLLTTLNKEHLPYINDVEYLYNNFGDWATCGSRNILAKSLQKPVGSGIEWYQDIWEFILGLFN